MSEGFKNILNIEEGVHGCHGAYLEALEQLFGIGSLLPPVYRFQILNAGHQTCSASTFTH